MLNNTYLILDLLMSQGEACITHVFIPDNVRIPNLIRAINISKMMEKRTGKKGEGQRCLCLNIVTQSWEKKDLARTEGNFRWNYRGHSQVTEDETKYRWVSNKYYLARISIEGMPEYNFMTSEVISGREIEEVNPINWEPCVSFGETRCDLKRGWTSSPLASR
jgi:hypothetical protein